MIDFKLLTIDHAADAGDLHRRAGALIPGYDTSLQPLGEFVDLYRDVVIPGGMTWGAFDQAALQGFVALLPGWIDHLYVEPGFHGQGLGAALVRLAQREQSELRLHTYQSNARARALYERHGFVIEQMTDGARNDEKMPDMTYRWTRVG